MVGDEFVALLRGLDKRQATEVAERVRDSLKATRFLGAEGLSVQLAASFGLATFPEDGDTLHGIIRAADAMMYCAKGQGRDRIAVADPRTVPQMPVSKVSRHS